jgi:8-oxo-dGTP pyrophosphatase MutT (NUDIX family)
VICKDTRNGVFFLPKGRKDASEETTITAIREGYEESGYRCRMLPLPIPHLQPSPATSASEEEEGRSTKHNKWVIEPLATRMMLVAREYQYLLFWYAAETVSEDEEKALNTVAAGDGFVSPEHFPENMTLKQREALDTREGRIYEPKRHEGTGVDEDEAFYVGMLVGVEEAMRLLGGTSADVVRRAWEGVCSRRKMEEKIK